MSHPKDDNQENSPHELLQNNRIANLEYSIQPTNFMFLNTLETVIEYLNPYTAKCELVRIGSYSDGGYVIASLSQISSKNCINLGVGNEVSADIDLLNLGCQILAVDGTVDNPMPQEARYKFVKSNVGYICGAGNKSLKSILKEHNWKKELEIVLIDIEGFEYQLLQNDWKSISRARQIVIEFHGLELLGDQGFSQQFVHLLKTINRTHNVVHIHGNNAGPAIPVGGASWPTIVEVTFLTKKEVLSERNFGPFPSLLDASNTGLRPDINLNPFFGINPTYSQLARNISKSVSG